MAASAASLRFFKRESLTQWHTARRRVRSETGGGAIGARIGKIKTVKLCRANQKRSAKNVLDPNVLRFEHHTICTKPICTQNWNLFAAHPKLIVKLFGRIRLKRSTVVETVESKLPNTFKLSSVNFSGVKRIIKNFVHVN